MLIGFILFSLAVCQGSFAQRRCSRDRMRQCMDGLTRSTQRRINDMGRSDMVAQCANVRDDFNCLLRETRCLTTETERNRNGDTLRNALKYIRDGCDSQGGTWRDNPCFVGEGMKNCESNYPLGGAQFSSYNSEACRKFNLFQDCVNEIVRNRCQQSDELHLGQYLVDAAQDLAWNCGESTSGSGTDYDRDRNDRDRNDRYGNDRYGDRRGSDTDRYRGGSNREYDRGGYRDDRYPERDRYSDRYNTGYGNGSSDITCCRNERCDRNRLQQCRDSLTRTIDSRMSGYQDSKSCRRARDDFNCLLWQTANCAKSDEKDRDNDLFRRARDYISRNCDTYGRWSENSCYKTTEMQRCEGSLTNARGNTNYESCRGYNSFKDCMTDELQRRCTREDELYQGAYLVDKAQEMSWQCGSDSFNVNGYGGGNGRNSYSTYDRREPYDNGYDSPQHLEDEDAMCQSRIQGLSDQCKNRLDEKRRELYTENDYDARQRITCCSAREYRSCLFDATKRVCDSERSRVVDSLMGRHRFELSADTCRRLYDSDCNGSSHNHISFWLLSACVTVLSLLFAVKW
ncbi:uncharacterized protein LOC129222657 isoform X2 [Uloborus diversus]|uniref:uncharacterized protein LOC129222657 isoform X2 n=1 Tax=Uloborus diversus TaxID=327109 RepID=UPI002408FCFF|nr:uncharacterized protein LOC129222657 isoform X2 [Uloborus diversus]